MKNLKGWWKEVEASVYENDKSESESASSELDAQNIPTTFMQFSKLSNLQISDCPNLRKLPLCPNVEDLSLTGMATTSTSSLLSSSVPSWSSIGSGSKLKKLMIDNADELMSLPNHCLHQLSLLKVEGDKKLESTERLGDVFATLSSSLRSLELSHCDKLKSIAKGLEHLTALETLQFTWCYNLDVWEDEEGMPWKALKTSLCSLKLEILPQLMSLPMGLQHLANLRSLILSGNFELDEVPKWISCFSSLEYLQFTHCPKLRGLPETLRQLTTLKLSDV